MSNSKNIYQRINAVMQEVKYTIKDKHVSGAGANYKAVTHDQVVSVARAAFVNHGIALEVTQTNGEFLVMRDINAQPEPIKMGLYSGTYQISLVNIDNPEDRSTGLIQAHANDNGDKAPGKALTYAVKSFILKSLWLETGENDESREEVRERVKRIDREQLKAIKAEVERTGSDPMEVYGYYKARNLADLTIASFNHAMDLLAAKPDAEKAAK